MNEKERIMPTDPLTKPVLDLTPKPMDEEVWAALFATICKAGILLDNFALRGFVTPLTTTVVQFVPKDKQELVVKKIMELDLELLRAASTFQDRFTDLIARRNIHAESMKKRTVIT